MCSSLPEVGVEDRLEGRRHIPAAVSCCRSQPSWAICPRLQAGAASRVDDIVLGKDIDGQRGNMSCTLLQLHLQVPGGSAQQFAMLAEGIAGADEDKTQNHVERPICKQVRQEGAVPGAQRFLSSL